MQPPVRLAGAPRRDAVAFLAELMRLQREVADIARQVERVEAELRESVSGLERARFEEYR
jgi:hypothetical protein